MTHERRKQVIEALIVWFIVMAILFIGWMVIAWTMQTVKDTAPALTTDSTERSSTESLPSDYQLYAGAM